MNHVEVMLFGDEARKLGRDRADVTLPPDATCATLRQQLIVQHAHLADHWRACRIAVNHDYATDQTAIRPGDEVAVIGMVNGG